MRKGMNDVDYFIRYFDSRLLKHEVISLEKLKLESQTFRELLIEALEVGNIPDGLSRRIRKELTR